MTCFTLLLVCGVSYSFEHNHFVKHGTGAGIRWRCTPSMSVHSSYWFFPLFFSFLSSEKHENEDEPCVYFSSCCMFLFFFSYSFKHFHKFTFLISLRPVFFFMLKWWRLICLVPRWWQVCENLMGELCDSSGDYKEPRIGSKSGVWAGFILISALQKKLKTGWQATKFSRQSQINHRSIRTAVDTTAKRDADVKAAVKLWAWSERSYSTQDFFLVYCIVDIVLGKTDIWCER